MEGNGTSKKKRRKRIIYVSIAVVLVLVVAGALIAATSGGTKIDPSKLAQVVYDGVHLVPIRGAASEVVSVARRARLGKRIGNEQGLLIREARVAGIVQRGPRRLTVAGKIHRKDIETGLGEVVHPAVILIREIEGWHC